MSPPENAARSHLLELARLCGVQAAYYDVDRRRRLASPDALLHVLRSLGARVETQRDVVAALRERRLERWRRPLEPVAVAWDGHASPVSLRLLAAEATGAAYCCLDIDGEVDRRWTARLEGLRRIGAAEVEGVAFVELALPLPAGLPSGYHRLSVQSGDQAAETLVISARNRSYAGPPRAKRWGVFMPLYAVRSSSDWGSGDFGGMEELLALVAGFGGGALATLPLLPAFLDEPFDPSPYSPVSRLFWNEFYVDVARVPELACCAPARNLIQSPEFQRELEDLRGRSLVDYRGVMRARRRVLEELSRSFFGTAGAERRAAFERFLAEHPAVADYARFRAAVERLALPWRAWPQHMRDGELADRDVEQDVGRYHQYAQWISHEQIQRVAGTARAENVDLYFDLPVGVHPDGYDAWRERASFAPTVSAGAPPDTFFSRGQNWAFPPLHPEAIRAQGYRYVIGALRHHLSAAAILRVDHIMGLHRMYWIPEGAAAAEGVYVRYPAEELYALLSLESHRHQAVIVGEDLGTVPRYVSAAMARHGIQGSYVLQYKASPSPARPLPSPHRNSVASLNTHDMPPFAAFWEGLDIDDHEELGLYDAATAVRQHSWLDATKRALVAFLRSGGWLESAAPDVREVQRACLRWLAGNASRFVLVNLEDTWLETRPQNVPGTCDERPNWRRKAGHTLREARAMPEVAGVLEEVGRVREGMGGGA